MSSGGPTAGHAEQPVDDAPAAVLHLRVVAGDPSAEELAVLSAVVAAAVGAGGAAGTGRPTPVRGAWNDPAALHRGRLPAGPGGWRAGFSPGR